MALALCGADDVEVAERDVKIVLLMDIRDIFARLFPEEHADHREKYGPRLSTSSCSRSFTSSRSGTGPLGAMRENRSPTRRSRNFCGIIEYDQAQFGWKTAHPQRPKATTSGPSATPFRATCPLPSHQAVTPTQAPRNKAKPPVLQTSRAALVTAQKMPETGAIPGVMSL
jgi:hypothetical protein